MRIGIILVCFLVSSCSLMAPRRNRYNNIERGMTKNDLYRDFGRPKKTLVNSDGTDSHIYKYCDFPLAADVVMTVFTLGISGTFWCSFDSVELEVITKDDRVVFIEDHVEKHRARMRENRRVGNGVYIPPVNPSRKPSRNQITQPMSVNCTHSGNVSTCRESGRQILSD